MWCLCKVTFSTLVCMLKTPCISSLLLHMSNCFCISTAYFVLFCFCFVLFLLPLRSLPQWWGLEKARAYLNQVPRDRRLYMYDVKILESHMAVWPDSPPRPRIWLVITLNSCVLIPMILVIVSDLIDKICCPLAYKSILVLVWISTIMWPIVIKIHSPIWLVPPGHSNNIHKKLSLSIVTGRSFSTRDCLASETNVSILAKDGMFYCVCRNASSCLAVF